MGPTRKVFLQVLWTGVDSSVPSLFLFTDSKRYIFNCSEGIQRLFTQYKMKIGKLDTFFLTRYQWSHMGGLPGFGMTLRDAKSHTKKEVEKSEKSQSKKKKKMSAKENNNNECTSTGVINVHAPARMRNIFSAARNFMKFDESGVNFNVIEHDEYNGSFRDEEMVVHAIPIHGEKDKTSFEHDNGHNHDFVNVSPSIPPPCLCYACHMLSVPGKFLAEKAVELGVPNGPMRGKLAKGETVTLPNGQEVKPDQVVAPQEPGPIFLVVDCPSLSYMSNLTQNEHIQKYATSEQEKVDLVLHLTKKKICKEQSYEEWLKRFPSTTKHFFLDELVQKREAFETQGFIQSKLHQISPQFFPLISLHEKIDNSLPFTEHTLMNFSKINLRDTVNKETGFMDHSEVCWDAAMKIAKINTATEENKNIEKIPEKDGQITDKKPCDISDFTLKNENGKRSLPEYYQPSSKKFAVDTNCYPRVVCLGTGAALPSKCRNVSATLIHLSIDDAILFDCGEDTYGQLRRHYGEGVDDVIRKIKMILISHMHADHHLGTITLLQKLNNLNQGTNDPVIIVAPNMLADWLVQYAETSEHVRFRFIDCYRIRRGIDFNCGVYVQSVKVEHPGSAHGYVVQYKDGSKITYSGDTMPSDWLVTAGYNSTLLIHEATLEDEMVEEALTKKHSTTSQALDVAHKMNAQNVLLTHFSQRYPRIPCLRNTKLEQHTAFAFDHLEIGINDFSKFHEIKSKVTSLFQDVEN